MRFRSGLNSGSGLIQWQPGRGAAQTGGGLLLQDCRAQPAKPRVSATLSGRKATILAYEATVPNELLQREALLTLALVLLAALQRGACAKCHVIGASQYAVASVP